MLDALIWLHSREFIDFVFNSGGVHIALLILFAIIFAETGLLVGFFLPGDSMLIFVGAAVGSIRTSAGEPIADIWLVYLVLMLAAIIGDQVGYYLGLKSGPAIFSREDSRFFKKKYVQEAHEFYVKHGGRAIILARFVPILRTFVPFMAGVADMPYKSFVFYNIVGGIIWVTSLLWLGYALGKSPVAIYLDKIILVVIVLSVLPLIIGFARRFLPGKAAPGAVEAEKAVPSAD
ncbi:hypothetical protein DB346_04895 [Verrucomicrobia bacterium LW23]|nr:hypothetical protein DB346_04895 [Verrucomicrobia bacterium LW23]